MSSCTEPPPAQLPNLPPSFLLGHSRSPRFPMSTEGLTGTREAGQATHQPCPNHSALLGEHAAAHGTPTHAWGWWPTHLGCPDATFTWFPHITFPSNLRIENHSQLVGRAETDDRPDWAQGLALALSCVRTRACDFLFAHPQQLARSAAGCLVEKALGISRTNGTVSHSTPSLGPQSTFKPPQTQGGTEIIPK